MRNRKNRTIAIGILCCLLVFMGVGFAAMSTRLNIGGTSTAINTWNILIESITPLENQTDAVSVSAEVDQATKTNASFRVDFTKPGDYMEYEIVLKNEGSIDGYLENASVNVADANNADNSLFVITSDVVLGTAIKTGERISFKVKIEYDKNATRLPSSEVEFILSADILQGEGTQGGNTPGGGNQGGATEPESDWLFEVDENGEIISYNYNSSQIETPQEVVVPAEVNGVPVTTITEQSFMPSGNVKVYSTDAGMMVVILDETNYEAIKSKFVNYFNLMCEYDGGDTPEEIAECKAMYEVAIQYYRDSDSNKVIPEGAESMPIYMNPDPNVSIEESLNTELTPNVKNLNLSNATNLTTIEEGALQNSGLESIDFGDNSSITTIGENAFANNALTEVEIPSSIEEIGDYAFSNNQIETLILETEGGVENQLTKNNKYSLKRLGTTPKTIATTLKGVKRIGSNAFSNNKIKTFTMPSTLESIENNAFSNNQISQLEITSTLETIGDYAFSNNQIRELVIPKTVNLGSYSFSNNQIETLTVGKCTSNSCYYNSFGTQIKTLTIESGEIGYNAFGSSESSTTKIESLTLGEGVTSIGQKAFQNNQISELVFPSTLTTIYSYAFKNNQISKLEIPKSLTTIESYVFENSPIETLTIEKCTTNICAYNSFGKKIKKLIIESGEIGYQAFYYSSSSSTMIDLTLGEGVTSIDSYAFAHSYISNLNIPLSLKSISSNVFYDTSIETLTIERCTTDICQSKQFGSKIKSLIVKSGEIGKDAFRSSSMENLTLKEGVTTIGSSAFESNKLTALDIPSSLTDIGSYAFSGNTIIELFVPENVLTLGAGAFQGTLTITFENFNENYIAPLQLARSVQNITILKGVIPDEAFKSYDDVKMGIEILTLGEGVTSIGNSAFINHEIKKLVLPDSLQSIGNSAFTNNSIEELTVGSGLTSLSENSFDKNTIRKLHIKRCTTEICRGSWSGNVYFGNQLEDLTIDSGEIGEYAFTGKYLDVQIKSLTLGNEITSIGTTSLAYNQISGKLVIPESVSSIGNGAFQGNNINSLEILSETIVIGTSAFTNNLLPDEQAFIYEKGSGNTVLLSYGGANRNNIKIPSTVKTIRTAAFSESQIRGNLIIPASVEKIERAAFGGNMISSLIFEEGSNLSEIGEVAFGYNQISGQLLLPNKLVTIGNSAFAGNQINSVLTIPDNVKTIGSSAFSENLISSLNIGKNVESIGYSAFNSQNRSLSSIRVNQTESDFLANVIVGTNWYDNTLNPTITYN